MNARCYTSCPACKNLRHHAALFSPRCRRPSTADAPGSTPAPKPPSSQQQQQQAAGLSPFGHPSDPALVRSCSLTASDGPTRCPSAAVLPQPSATGSTMLPHPQHMQPPHQLHLLGAPAVQHGGCFSVPPQPQYHPHHHHHPHHAPALLYHQQPGVLLAAAVPPPQQAAWGFPYSWSSNNIQALGTDEVRVMFVPHFRRALCASAVHAVHAGCCRLVGLLWCMQHAVRKS